MSWVYGHELQRACSPPKDPLKNAGAALNAIAHNATRDGPLIKLQISYHVQMAWWHARCGAYNLGGKDIPTCGSCPTNKIRQACQYCALPAAAALGVIGCGLQ